MGNIDWAFIGIVGGIMILLYLVQFLLSKIGINIKLGVILNFIASALVSPFKD